MATPPGKPDSCIVVLIIGASLLTGLTYLVTEAARWVL